MTFYAQRAIKDILENRFLNAVTIITIALSVLIVSSFGLFFFNAQELFDAWKKGVRIMVYLEPGTTEAQRLDTRYRLQTISGIQNIRFISKADALNLMKTRMQRQASLLDNLRENPLPDAFEVTMATEANSPEKIEFLAQRIESLPSVSGVEYGQQWIERFANFLNLFKLAGYGMGTLFFMATVFIAANTIRLVLYSRREEIHIMRLVGATDSFIKIPFYLQGIIQGLSGGLIGVGVLFAAFSAVGSRFEQALAAEMVAIRFFSPGICVAIVACGMLTGLLGSFFSLKQFTRQ
ncbi:cell division protein FtsX [Desulfosarcina widdelii]|uniref:Cell division protein FtsX n=1 Tax=Desulfosarcina widdelii TaxID=947919 RepID=A0A5K7Z6Q2_9BACT|nr:permease-like cell division protein FtsX [Desulfosarcina widdelii]BBO76698.1 cell division protein FtsX [Desulfosarcina widdelii]